MAQTRDQAYQPLTAHEVPVWPQLAEADYDDDAPPPNSGGGGASTPDEDLSTSLLIGGTIGVYPKELPARSTWSTMHRLYWAIPLVITISLAIIQIAYGASYDNTTYRTYNVMAGVFTISAAVSRIYPLRTWYALLLYVVLEAVTFMWTWVGLLVVVYVTGETQLILWIGISNATWYAVRGAVTTYVLNRDIFQRP